MTDDPYRYCIYCEADCYADEPEHGPECPSTTGVYPVRAEDLGPACRNCGERTMGFGCVDCGAELQVGDFYMHRVVEEGDPLVPGVCGAEICEIVCIGCAATKAIA